MSQLVALRPKWVPMLTYLLYSCAGIAFLVLPSQGLKELLGAAGFVLWNFLLSFGGVAALFGILYRSTSIELIGLPGVIAGMFVYACYLLELGIVSSPGQGLYLGFGLILLAATLGLIGRIYEVRELNRLRKKVSRRVREDRGQ